MEAIGITDIKNEGGMDRLMEYLIFCMENVERAYNIGNDNSWCKSEESAQVRDKGKGPAKTVTTEGFLERIDPKEGAPARPSPKPAPRDGGNAVPKVSSNSLSKPSGHGQ